MIEIKDLSKKGKDYFMGFKKKICILAMVVIVAVGIAVYVLTRPAIVFCRKTETIEINSQYDATSFIEKIRGYDLNDVKIDDQVNVQKLGHYVIAYQVDDKEYKLDVEVVDTKAPDFDIKKDVTCDISGKLDAQELVTNIKDETKTKVFFKEDYNFKKAGKLKVTVVVEDEGKNQTEKQTTIELVKDQEAPVLEGVQDIRVLQNKEIDYLKNIKAVDDFDPEPVIKVDDSQVDLSKLGTYKVVYTASDRSKNKKEYECSVSVVNQLTPVDQGQSNEKIVYLTFDDGPSANTKKILDILDKYNAKATFFVTGANPKYNYLIKEAHQKGHTIALHTYSHKYDQVYRSVDAYFDDLTKVGNIVKDEIGFVPHYIRFPGGSSNTISKRYCPGIMTQLTKEVKNRGYQYYDWNADSTDASGNNVAVSQLIANGTSSQANNINLLCHDTDAKGTTVQALPSIIEYYQQKGYQFKAIDDHSFTPHQGVNN